MYTKHQWESDKHFNFRYVKYLPKDFDINKNKNQKDIIKMYNNETNTVCTNKIIVK